MLYIYYILFKVALGVSQHFFIWTRVLKHNNYVEIKLVSKVDIKQNNVSTDILLIKFLVYQWDQRHLQGSRVVYIFVYITKSVFFLFLCISIIRILFIVIISDVYKDFSSLRMKTETESKNRGLVYLYHEDIGEAAF